MKIHISILYIDSAVIGYMYTKSKGSPFSMQSTRLEDPQLATALPEEGTGENEDKTLSPVKLSTRPGAKTSDFYSVKNIPERFNHPGIYMHVHT